MFQGPDLDVVGKRLQHNEQVELGLGKLLVAVVPLQVEHLPLSYLAVYTYI